MYGLQNTLDCKNIYIYIYISPENKKGKIKKIYKTNNVINQHILYLKMIKLMMWDAKHGMKSGK